MPPPAPRYQIALLAANPAAPEPSMLRSTLEGRVRDLGLDPERDLRFLAEADLSTRDPRGPLAVVYFGASAAPARSGGVEAMVAAGVFVLPVVATLAGYTAQVPAALHPINGIALDPADPTLEAVAARVLEELRLLRGRRYAFVSYRRAESRAVAVQLYHRLDDRGFGVFLDTHRVAPGVNVQDVLLDRMTDADVIVFLDTPGALSSTWVEREVLHAQHLGVAALQVVWPGHTRAPVTELMDPLYLDDVDFTEPAAPHATASAELTDAALDRIAVRVEQARARAQAARRTRLVEALCRAAQAAKLGVVAQPTGAVEVVHPRRGRLRVLPVMGHPTASHYQRAHNDHPSAAGEERVILLHDSDGFLAARRAHLAWLDAHLPVASLDAGDLTRWITRT
jgi:hypothetical protein